MKWCRALYHQCNVWVIIFLNQALNDFHGSLYFPITSKDSVGETIFGCKLLVFKGCIWGSIFQYNFLKYPCLEKIDFMRDYLRRRLPIQFTYLDIPGVIINNK